MAEILTAEGLFVTNNSACLTRQVETGDISNEEEEALLSEKKTEISEEVIITLLDTKVYKGATFHKESILDVQTYYKPTENFYSCHPPGVIKRRYPKGEALRLLTTNSSQLSFEDNMKNYEKRLQLMF